MGAADITATTMAPTAINVTTASTVNDRIEMFLVTEGDDA
jgi:hypothetical protein